MQSNAPWSRLIHRRRLILVGWAGLLTVLVARGLMRSPSKLGFFLLVNTRYRGELKRMQFQPFGDPRDQSLLPVPAVVR